MTAPNLPACATPISADDLMDYWLADLPAETEAVVEEHLFTCDACGDRLRQTITLAERLGLLVRSGTLQVIVGDPFVQHAVATGLRVREYAPAPGESVQCTVSADDDLLVARLATGMIAAARVDLSWCDPSGVEHQRMTDIPIDQDAGAVICQQSMLWAKASPTTSMVARLLAVDPGGDERVLGEYTFHHTRTIPGPPGW